MLDSKKLYVQQKTKRGVERVTPVYLPIDSTSRITIPKLQFNRSTPSNKNRNLSDSYFQLIVSISAITANNQEVPVTIFTSDNLNVLSCTPSQYDYDRNSRSKTSNRKYSSDSFSTLTESFDYDSYPSDYNQTPPPDFNQNQIAYTAPTSFGIAKLSPISNGLSLDYENTFSKRTSIDVFADIHPPITYDPIDSMVYNFLMEPFCN